MAAASTPDARRALPRPPRPPEGPLLLHTPAGVPGHASNSGPGWVKAPPPAYHLSAAANLVEPIAVGGAAVHVDPVATGPVRCPRCRDTFEWTLERPAAVTCPHCGVKGTLKANSPTP